MKTILSALCILSTALQLSKAADQPPVPDFTKGDTIPEKSHDWNLGPTGARGWIYGYRGESNEARQIFITEVDSQSPSAKALKVGDVIIGLAGKNFTSDARISFAHAITAAEATDGKLRLNVWRDGSRIDAVIQLEAIGSYGATAPWDCPKSQRIFEQGCKRLAKRMQADIQSKAKRKHPIQHMLNALALLSSPDRDNYMPVIKHEVEWAKKWMVHNGLYCWDAGWVNLLLAEYFLATKDESVLPDLKRISLAIAGGQSNVGTWGHRFAYKHNGILMGYGAMNQVGLSLTTSLVVARDAGVTDPKVYQAIDKSSRFLHFYAGKGALPYGDHHPWLQMHDDNGKASAAAVLFDLLDDPEASEFFSRMGTASYGIERESGHTGNFFNMLWSLPGISRSGPEATGAWIRESSWLLDLARRHDYSFDYLGIPGDHNSYHGWDCTGAYLLGLGVAHGQIRFTGKDSSAVTQLNRADAKQIIEDGIGWTPRSKGESYNSRTTKELLSKLSNWSPVVRERAAIALALREGDFTPQLLKIANSNDPNAKLGVCAAFEQLGARASAGVPILTEFLSSDDLWLRVQAAEALAKIGKAAAPAIPILLRLVAQPADSSDPRAHNQRFIAFALFNQRGGLLSKTIEHVDRDLLRNAIVSILKNEDGRARGSLASVYRHLSYEEIQPILPAVMEAITHQSPSGVMFSDGIRQAGLEVLAKYRISEGIPLCMEIIELDRWGGERRMKSYLKILASYGVEATSQIPSLKSLAEDIASNPKFDRRKQVRAEHIMLIEKTIENILEAKPGEPLRSITH